VESSVSGDSGLHGRIMAILEVLSAAFATNLLRSLFPRPNSTNTKVAETFFTKLDFHEFHNRMEQDLMEQQIQSCGSFNNQVRYQDKAGELWGRALTALNNGVPWLSRMCIQVECHREEDINLFWKLLAETSWSKIPHLKQALRFERATKPVGRRAVDPGKLALAIGDRVFYTNVKDSLKDSHALVTALIPVVTYFHGIMFLPVVSLPMPVIGIDGDAMGNISATLINARGILNDHLTVNSGIHGELRTPETLLHILETLTRDHDIKKEDPFILHIDGKLTGPLSRKISEFLKAYPLMEIVELPKYVSPLMGREQENAMAGDYVVLNEKQGAVVGNAQNRSMRCPAGTFVQKQSGSLSIEKHLNVVYQLCQADPFSLFHTPSIPLSIRLAADKAFLGRSLISAYKKVGII